MSYVPYATPEDYKQYGSEDIPANELEKALRRASRQIDSLTYNRIIGRGFSNMTEFQQEIVKEVCCQQAGFYYNNQDLIESALKSHSINGVSMSFGSGENVKCVNGVFIHSNTYALLAQTGLTCRLAV